MKEVNETYLRKIYLNVLKAIVIVLYFFILNLAYENIKIEYLEIGIKIFSMIFLLITIYIFEIAYKKDDEQLALQGIEILVLATYTLTTKHITNKFDFNFKSYSLVASYIFAIYFILKSIIIYTKGRNEMAKQYSDIREIVKKEEPIKKEATKKIKKDNDIKENKISQSNKTKTQEKTKATRKSTKKVEKDPKNNSNNINETKSKVETKSTKKKMAKKETKNTNKENNKIRTETKKKSTTVKKKKEEVKEND